MTDLTSKGKTNYASKEKQENIFEIFKYEKTS